MKKTSSLILLVTLVTISCKDHQKVETNKPIRLTSESYLRSKIAGNIAPDSTQLSLLFESLNYRVKDTFSIHPKFNVDIELAGNTIDPTTLKHDLRFWVQKDTASKVSIKITHDDFVQVLSYNRGQKLDSNFFFTANETKVFKGGLQRYNVEIDIRNYKKNETQLQIDSWDVTLQK
jgi:hypothetical protein